MLSRKLMRIVLALLSVCLLLAACGAPTYSRTEITLPNGASWVQECELPGKRGEPVVCTREGDLGDLAIRVDQELEHRRQTARGYVQIDPTADPVVEAGACFDVLTFDECYGLHEPEPE